MQVKLNYDEAQSLCAEQVANLLNLDKMNISVDIDIKRTYMPHDTEAFKNEMKNVAAFHDSNDKIRLIKALRTACPQLSLYEAKWITEAMLPQMDTMNSFGNYRKQ